jgi:hypothetical protein
MAAVLRALVWPRGRVGQSSLHEGEQKTKLGLSSPVRPAELEAVTQPGKDGVDITHPHDQRGELLVGVEGVDMACAQPRILDVVEVCTNMPCWLCFLHLSSCQQLTLFVE